MLIRSTDPDMHVFALSEEKKKKNFLLADDGGNGSNLTILNSFFFLGMSEEKIRIKAERLLFFLVGHNFYMSEDSLTVKYTESGLDIYI